MKNNIFNIIIVLLSMVILITSCHDFLTEDDFKDDFKDDFDEASILQSYSNLIPASTIPEDKTYNHD